MIDAIRRQQLIRFAEDKARDHALSYEEIAAFRDIAALLAQPSPAPRAVSTPDAQ